jgi:hypothetical protein
VPRRDVALSSRLGEPQAAETESEANRKRIVKLTGYTGSGNLVLQGSSLGCGVHLVCHFETKGRNQGDQEDEDDELKSGKHPGLGLEALGSRTRWMVHHLRAETSGNPCGRGETVGNRCIRERIKSTPCVRDSSQPPPTGNRPSARRNRYL